MNNKYAAKEKRNVLNVFLVYVFGGNNRWTSPINYR